MTSENLSTVTAVKKDSESLQKSKQKYLRHRPNKEKRNSHNKENQTKKHTR